MKDSSRHVILGVQQFKPAEFGAQINLSMDNAWGIVRCIVDLVRKQKDGKYLIVKDPMKPVIRLYDIPDSTFDSEDESDDEDEGKCPLERMSFFFASLRAPCLLACLFEMSDEQARKGRKRFCVCFVSVFHALLHMCSRKSSHGNVHT